MVEASSVIIVSDNSREANEADAQSIRVSVLIDEVVQKHEAKLRTNERQALTTYKRPHLVVEVLESRNCGALDFSTEIGVTPSKDVPNILPSVSAKLGYNERFGST